MKKLRLLLILLAITLATHAQQHIKQYIVHFSPTGASDKPVDELTLQLGTTQVQTNDFRVVIMTDAATLRNVIGYIQSNRIRHSSPGAEFGSYRVVVFNQVSLVTEYYLSSHQQSKSYLKRLIALLSAKHADKNVIDELQKILIRIDY